MSRFYTCGSKLYPYFCPVDMDKFEVIQPTSLLAPYVKQYWFLSIGNIQQDSQRVVPSGSISLLFHRSGTIRTTMQTSAEPTVYISGQTGSYADTFYSGNLDFIMVVFHPAGARAILHIPTDELNNQHIPATLLNDQLLIDLGEKLCYTYDNHACVNLIEAYMLKRIYAFTDYNQQRITSVIRYINSGIYDISTLAQSACLGYKQFKRIFSSYIGCNPKEFVRVARFRKASLQLQMYSQISLTQLAQECGFYDKSHLIKEFRELSGHNPSEYLAVCDPYSGYHSLFRCTFLDNPPDQPKTQLKHIYNETNTRLRPEPD